MENVNIKRLTIYSFSILVLIISSISFYKIRNHLVDVDYKHQLLQVKKDLHSRAMECAKEHEKIVMKTCIPYEYRWKTLGYKTPDECITEMRASFCGRYYDVLNIK